jgi:hypothetical protein
MEFAPEQIAPLLTALGLPDGTDDPQLIVDTAVDLAAQVEAFDPAKPSSVAAAAKRNGMELIDIATADALRRDAAEGRRIAAAAAKAKVEAAVEDAINTGRITPSSKQHWLTLCTNDDAMLERLASIAPGTAVALSEIGHAADNTDLVEPANWFW